MVAWDPERDPPGSLDKPRGLCYKIRCVWILDKREMAGRMADGHRRRPAPPLWGLIPIAACGVSCTLTTELWQEVRERLAEVLRSDLTPREVNLLGI